MSRWHFEVKTAELSKSYDIIPPTMTHEVPQEVPAYKFPLDVDKQTAFEIARQNLLTWLTPPETAKKSPIIAKLYQTRKNVMEDRILKHNADARVCLNGDYKNFYRFQGRIGLRGEEPGAELPGGYIYEMNTSHELTEYLWRAVSHYRRDYDGAGAHYTAANALRGIIDVAFPPKSQPFQRRQK